MNGFVIPTINFHFPFYSSVPAEEDVFFEFLDLAFFPLLNVLERMENDGIEYSLTLSFSTSFTCLINNPSIINRYCKRTKKLQADEERIDRKDALRDILFWLNQYQYQPLAALRRLAAYGHLEIITDGTATNAPLPLLAPVPEAVKAQISVSLAAHKHFFENDSKGITLNPKNCYRKLSDLLKENGLEYAIIAPLSANNAKETSYPILVNDNIGLIVDNGPLSESFAEYLKSEWQNADENANAFIQSILNTIVTNDKKEKESQKVFLLYADALQLFEGKRNKKLNMMFLELLVRKISCDRKEEILLEKPGSYLSAAKDFLNLDDLGVFSQNLSQYFQVGYQTLFPDLHIAAMKLVKFNHSGDTGMAKVKSKLTKELLLAQSGDHLPGTDTFCREHLQKFTDLINCFDDAIKREDTTFINIEESNDDFLSNIDLSMFY